MHVLEDRQTRHQPDGQRRPARTIAINRARLPTQDLPIDCARQFGQRVSRVDDLIQPGSQKVMLAFDGQAKSFRHEYDERICKVFLY